MQEENKNIFIASTYIYKFILYLWNGLYQFRYIYIEINTWLAFEGGVRMSQDNLYIYRHVYSKSTIPLSL